MYKSKVRCRHCIRFHYLLALLEITAHLPATVFGAASGWAICVGGAAHERAQSAGEEKEEVDGQKKY